MIEIVAQTVPVVHSNSVNFAQLAATSTAIIGSIVVILTFALSRLDKGRKATNDRMDTDKAELRALIASIAAALGVRLDKVDERMQKQGEDIAEIKGMSKTSERLDRGENRSRNDES